MSDSPLESPYSVDVEDVAIDDITRVCSSVADTYGIMAGLAYRQKLKETAVQLGSIPGTGNTDSVRGKLVRYTPNHDRMYNLWFTVDDAARIVTVHCIWARGNRPPGSRF